MGSFVTPSAMKVDNSQPPYPLYSSMAITSALNYNYFMDQLSPHVKKIDLKQAFLSHFEEDELQDLYFKTDHHWDIDGAFFAYQRIISSMDQQSEKFADSSLASVDIESKWHNGAFSWSYNTKLYRLINSRAEETMTFSPKEGFHFTRMNAIDRFGRELNNLDTIYSSKANQEEFDYPGLYAGDYSIMNYEKVSSNNLHLLIIKDSYANLITPFIANHFDRTTVLDLRHYQKGNIAEYCIQNNVDIVLFLYNDINITPNEMYDFQ